MIAPCDCWHQRKTIWGDIIDECWGTKECDACSCGGDRSKCDFYENVRERARQQLLEKTAWFGGVIDRRKLVEELTKRKEECPQWVYEVIGQQEVIK